MSYNNLKDVTGFYIGIHLSIHFIEDFFPSLFQSIKREKNLTVSQGDLQADSLCPVGLQPHVSFNLRFKGWTSLF
jgi:hypothetical protein